MLLQFSFVGVFCWTEIPRLGLYLPAVCMRIQQLRRGKTLKF